MRFYQLIPLAILLKQTASLPDACDGDTDYNSLDLKLWSKFYSNTMKSAKFCFGEDVKEDPCCACSQEKIPEEEDVFVRCKIVDDEKFISSIHMKNNNLEGELPLSITSMKHLKILDLRGNAGLVASKKCYEEEDLCDGLSRCRLCDGSDCNGLLCNDDTESDESEYESEEEEEPSKKVSEKVYDRASNDDYKDSREYEETEVSEGESNNADEGENNGHGMVIWIPMLVTLSLSVMVIGFVSKKDYESELEQDQDQPQDGFKIKRGLRFLQKRARSFSVDSGALAKKGIKSIKKQMGLGKRYDTSEYQNPNNEIDGLLANESFDENLIKEAQEQGYRPLFV